jgi:uncharacterized protein (DUF983 family)
MTSTRQFICTNCGDHVMSFGFIDNEDVCQLCRFLIKAAAATTDPVLRLQIERMIKRNKEE